MIAEVLIFIFLWFTMCGLWHEMMHALEAARQGVKDLRIIPKFKPLPRISFRFTGDAKNRPGIDLAGGLYTGILCYLLVLLSSGTWRDAFFILGHVQVLYGIYEMKYLHIWNTRKPFDKYDLGRYALYIMVTIACIVLLKLTDI